MKSQILSRFLESAIKESRYNKGNFEKLLSTIDLSTTEAGLLLRLYIHYIKSMASRITVDLLSESITIFEGLKDKTANDINGIPEKRKLLEGYVRETFENNIKPELLDYLISILFDDLAEPKSNGHQLSPKLEIIVYAASSSESGL